MGCDWPANAGCDPNAIQVAEINAEEEEDNEVTDGDMAVVGGAPAVTPAATTTAAPVTPAPTAAPSVPAATVDETGMKVVCCK